MRHFIVVVVVLALTASIFCISVAHAGYTRCSDGSLLGEGGNISKCNMSTHSYRVQNSMADIVKATDKYGQEIIIIDGKVISIGR